MDGDFFIYTFKKAETTRVLLIVLFISGIYFGISVPSFFAFLLSGVSAFFLFSKNGIIIDIENNRYKQARIHRQFYIGTWKMMPQVSYISMFRTIITTNSSSLSGRTTSLKERVISINLVHNKNQRLTV